MGSRARRALASVGASLAGLLLAACGDATPATPVPTGATTIMDGRGLYAAHCGRCHGGDLKGTSLGPPLLDAIYAPGHHPDAAFFAAVRNGVKPHHWNFGPMPPVEGLSDSQVAAILAFVRADQEAVGIR